MKILLMIAGCLTIHLSILVCIHRIAISLLKKPRDSQKMIPSQGLATKVVVFQYLVAMLIGAAAWFSGYLSLGWLLYLLIATSGVSYCYWGLLVLTESGRRYIILERVDRQPGLQKADILGAYNAPLIVDLRLARLLHWRSIQRQGDRYVGRPCFLTKMSKLILLWARLLSFSWTRRV
jgi:hypothetical protein